MNEWLLLLFGLSASLWTEVVGGILIRIRLQLTPSNSTHNLAAIAFTRAKIHSPKQLFYQNEYCDELYWKYICYLLFSAESDQKTCVLFRASVSFKFDVYFREFILIELRSVTFRSIWDKWRNSWIVASILPSVTDYAVIMCHFSSQ